MNLLRVLLVPAAAWLAAGALLAAPIPDRTPSQGPISDFLRQRDNLPTTPAPTAIKFELRGDTLEATEHRVQYVPQVRQRFIQADGVNRVVTETVTVPVATVVKRAVAVKDCKFFTVTDAKLRPLDLDRAKAMLKEPTAILTGTTAEVDPRHLEMVKPGTLYLVVPPAGPMVEPIPPRVPQN
jgi:hypothetical protein